MSIGIKNYVNIRSSLPEGASNARSFGGLVFTASEMMSTASLKSEYDTYKAVTASINEVKECFGESSEEYAFAKKYYGYSSPSGNVPSSLKFAKVKKLEYVAYQTGVAYAKGDFVKNSVTNYVCKTAVTATENTSWDSVSSSFTESSATHENPSSALIRVDEDGSGFGSFTFLDTDTAAFQADGLVEVAATNSGFGNKYLFVVNDVRETKSASAVVAVKNVYSAVDGTMFISGNDAYSAYMPMSIFAATDYTNGVVTAHMFKQFATEKPTVKNDGEYEKFKGANVNFYGRTQSNGATIDFFQRGFNTNGTDTAIYCNEIWFKAACETKIINLLINQERVPANDAGLALVLDAVSDICDSATNNGAFMAKSVSRDARTQIRNIIERLGGGSEDADAVIAGVENVGYSVFGRIVTGEDGQYYIRYFVFYGTADSIRFVQGDDIGIQ